MNLIQRLVKFFAKEPMQPKVPDQLVSESLCDDYASTNDSIPTVHHWPKTFDRDAK